MTRKTFDLDVIVVAGTVLGVLPLLRLWSTRTLGDGAEGTGLKYEVAKYVKLAVG